MKCKQTESDQSRGHGGRSESCFLPVLAGTLALIVISLPGCSSQSGSEQTSTTTQQQNPAPNGIQVEQGAGSTPQQADGPPRNSLLNQADGGNNQRGSEMTNAVTTASGLQYEELTVGTGASPQPGQRVTVHYTGWLTNGTKFDSSVDRGQPFQFNIGRGEVIKGWDEGVMTMKIGGKRKLIIPAELGYGARGAGGLIPPGATLIFEVDLLGTQ